MAGQARVTPHSWRNRWRALWRKHLQPVWLDIEWPLVGAIWALALILGYIGFDRLTRAAGEPAGAWTLLYRDLQLIVLQSGDVAGRLPWTLEAARFLMPAVAGYTAIQALLAVFREQWRLIGLRLVKSHAVVCGLGETGLRLVRNFLDEGHRVVAIEKDEENPSIDRCREQGAVVLVGDAQDQRTLRRAGVPKAAYLVAVCADDGANAEIALQARGLVRGRRGRALDAFVHIVDLELCNLLGGGAIETPEEGPFRLEFFNVMEEGARLMLAEHPPYGRVPGPGDRPPRVLVVGLGKLGRSLVVQAARDWWTTRRPANGRKMRISVIDQDAGAKVDLLRLRYPRLDEACELDPRPMRKNDPAFERGDFLADADGRMDVDVIYICFDDDVHVLVDALTLLRKTRSHNVPVVARLGRESGLAALLREGPGAGDFSSLHVFGLLDRTCGLEALLGGKREILARAIHEDYVRRRKEAGATAPSNPSLVGWQDLPADLKESNRRQAGHIETKLRAIGCGLQSLTDWAAASFESLPAEVMAVFDVERLARMEHERWCEERRLRGWTYAPGAKDLQKKTSPYLVPWEELAEEIREFDREAVRGLPAFLGRAGFQIFRRS